jgi:hypothetical protein
MPFRGHVGEAPAGHVEPLDGAGPRGLHVDVEDPGEGRLAGEELKERPEAGPQHGLVRDSRGQRARGCHHLVGHQLAALARRGEEAVLLVREVRVEGGAGHPRAAHDVRDRDGRVAGFGHRGDRRPVQPPHLGCPDVPRRQPAPAPGQARLAVVRFG